MTNLLKTKLVLLIKIINTFHIIKKKLKFMLKGPLGKRNLQR